METAEGSELQRWGGWGSRDCKHHTCNWHVPCFSSDSKFRSLPVNDDCNMIHYAHGRTWFCWILMNVRQNLSKVGVLVLGSWCTAAACAARGRDAGEHWGGWLQVHGADRGFVHGKRSWLCSRPLLRCPWKPPVDQENHVWPSRRAWSNCFVSGMMSDHVSLCDVFLVKGNIFYTNLALMLGLLGHFIDVYCMSFALSMLFFFWWPSTFHWQSLLVSSGHPLSRSSSANWNFNPCRTTIFHAFQLNWQPSRVGITTAFQDHVPGLRYVMTRFSFQVFLLNHIMCHNICVNWKPSWQMTFKGSLLMAFNCSVHLRAIEIHCLKMSWENRLYCMNVPVLSIVIS